MANGFSFIEPGRCSGWAIVECMPLAGMEDKFHEFQTTFIRLAGERRVQVRDWTALSATYHVAIDLPMLILRVM